MSTYITNEAAKYKAQDLDFLFKEGVRIIQELDGVNWTNFNDPDPGVTLLEHLCYAITELAYRADIEIGEQLEGKAKQVLWTSSQSLPCSPVTINDLRKLLLDTKGVKNAWVKPITSTDPAMYVEEEQRLIHLAEVEGAKTLTLKGLFDVFIIPESGDAEVTSLVKKALAANRSLCQDINQIKLLDAQNIVLVGNIELQSFDRMEETVANVMWQADQIIAPSIRFLTLTEMLQKGFSVEDMFEGPRLTNGFILNEDLDKSPMPEYLYTSDIIKGLMDLPGLRSVNTLSIGLSDNMGAFTNPQPWQVLIPKGYAPRLHISKSLKSITFTINDKEVYPDLALATTLYEKIKDQNKIAKTSSADANLNPLSKEKGDTFYYSLQEELPSVFGTTSLGLGNQVGITRIAYANQLKAYLILFEQVLANFSAQINHLPDLFSFDPKNLSSYFQKNIQNSIPNGAHLFTGQYAAVMNDWLFDKLDDYSEKDVDEITAEIERKQRFINHLLARFGETFNNVSIQNINDQPLYSSQEIVAAKKNLLKNRIKELRQKMNFLQAFPDMSYRRACAFNYLGETWDTGNVSGLEQRIALKLGLINYDRRNLSNNDGKVSEGFHLVEHILLRPLTEDQELLSKYMKPGIISKITPTINESHFDYLCASPSHGLQANEIIRISGNLDNSEGNLNGYFQVYSVKENEFVARIPDTPIDGGFNFEIVGNKNYWIRTNIDTAFILLKKPVFVRLLNNKEWTNYQDILKNPPANGFTISDFTVFDIKKNENKGIKAGDKIMVQLPEAMAKEYEVLVSTSDIMIIKNTLPSIVDKPFYWWRADSLFDPFSLQLTFVLPNWPTRFSDPSFQKFAESVIREETPAHLAVSILWLSQEEMAPFEKSWKNFLKELGTIKS